MGEAGREGGFQRRGADGVAVSAKCDDTNGECAFGIGIGRKVRGRIALPAGAVPSRPFPFERGGERGNGLKVLPEGVDGDFRKHDPPCPGWAGNAKRRTFRPGARESGAFGA